MSLSSNIQSGGGLARECDIVSASTKAPAAVATIARRKAYAVPRPRGPIDLRLDGNEGPAPAAALLSQTVLEPEQLRRYPNAASLESLLAERVGAAPEQVLVTAGADDGLDRACRALLTTGRELLLPVPTFEMIARYAEMTGAEIRTVAWEGGAYPLDAVLAQLRESTAAIAMVSPNNPTGAVVTEAELRALSAKAPGAMVLLDHAYVEMADEDLTQVALTLPNVLVFRTLSKAWGMAGLRLGYVIGQSQHIDWLRRSGHPYPVSAASLAFAETRLRMADNAVQSYRDCVVQERDALATAMTAPGVVASPSQANFVFARGPRARWLRQGLASVGIAVRGWGEGSALGDAVRVTCPGEAVAYQRLARALDATLRPEAMLFDMDGVLVDVRASYRGAILATAKHYGVKLSLEDIAAAKREPDSNNDWRVTQRILQRRGVDCSLEEVIEIFELAYQGSDNAAGLHLLERPMVSAQWLASLARQFPLAVVTGRPRLDAERYLKREGIAQYFSALVCMEDAPAKPDPAAPLLALSQLGLRSAWMFGDTPDDITAARCAEVVSIGIVAEDDSQTRAALLNAGAAVLLSSVEQIEEQLA